ncbi:monooxygenase [Corticibacter populi]|uniref:Monooxygenase n=1 Tax=Corticibacter populi TaxID=1550736 RepID=A0A3M6R0A9_9BURK|nr:acyl-CoA dehydrogenase family protein [Corticibacter populi]RMX08697.1 monooxygenase [Corticibacter populi]RZS36045.1 alkylation response protein AidB-like acyl-CoA dehydrogenase [Corticibacter populi]
MSVAPDQLLTALRPGSTAAAPAASAHAIAAGNPADVARQLARQFAATAPARDAAGGTPKAERDALRASGLLALSIPTEYGGLGANWVDTLDAVRTLATADSSLAHVFGFQHLHLATVQLFGQPAQWRPWLVQTARNHWFWGNTLNPLDTRTVATRQDGYWEFSGKKSFTSGALDSQMLVASAIDAQSGKLLIAVIPTERAGITLQHDWNNIGQRQTDSGSALFERVRVEQAELLLDPGPLSTPYASLRPLLAQLIFAHLFLGIAQGALAEARQYTLHEAKPWFRSEAEAASKDVHVLVHYGEFWTALEGARLLTRQAAQVFEQAWQKGPALTTEERGEVAVAVTVAKIATSKVGLDLTSRIFEVTGARATHAALRLDRFWRNLRTQTLHDPLHYKLQELGDWALNGDYPAPSFYS